MSRSYGYATMAGPNPYPYSGNYAPLYWNPQTENVAAPGYFEPYRLANPLSGVSAAQNYGPCKYTEADSTQQTPQRPNEKQSHSAPPSESTLLTPPDHPAFTVLTRPSSSKRKPTPVSDERKDDHYWDRRNRNNESAKKSRQHRKNREEMAAYRCSVLERDNMQLHAQVMQLRAEKHLLEEQLKKYGCI